MGPSDFGPFASAFAKGELRVPGDLTLLHCSDGALVVMRRIEEAVATSDAALYVRIMFEDAHWGPHLVAAVALLLRDFGGAASPWLWGAIDRGSWVTPQLVATAFLARCDFEANAFARLDQLCPIQEPANLSAVERHSATGPAGTAERRAKQAASIFAIASAAPALATRVAAYAAAPPMQQLLDLDARFDQSDDIARSWLAAIRERLAELGRSPE